MGLRRSLGGRVIRPRRKSLVAAFAVLAVFLVFTAISAADPAVTASLTSSPSPATGKAPLTVAFDGSGSNSPAPLTTWSLDFGDGTRPPPESARRRPASRMTTRSAPWTATLTVTDEDGDSDTATDRRQLESERRTDREPDLDPVAGGRACAAGRDVPRNRELGFGRVDRVVVARLRRRHRRCHRHRHSAGEHPHPLVRGRELHRDSDRDRRRRSDRHGLGRRQGKCRPNRRAELDTVARDRQGSAERHLQRLGEAPTPTGRSPPGRWLTATGTRLPGPARHRRRSARTATPPETVRRC